MTTKARTWKTADEIATLFATRRDGGVQSERSWWLSRKQTDWLVSQAYKEGNYHEHVAAGTLDNGAHWTCRVSPVNGCGLFKIGQDRATFTAAFEAERASKRAELEASVARLQGLLPGGAEYASLTLDQAAAVEPMLGFVREQLARAKGELAGITEAGS